MRTDGQTGMTKLIFGFCNFANAPKNALKDTFSLSVQRVLLRNKRVGGDEVS